MSAGSAFASGVRAGQAIWNSAVSNAMAGKRLDMLKTQFKFEQLQRKKALDNELASQTAKDKFVDYLPAAVASGEIDFSTPEGREHYSSLKSSVEPTIMRDPATWKQYKAISEEFEEKEGYPVFKAHERTILNIGVTWDQNNPGMPRPQIEDPKTGEMVDNTNQMDEDNYSRTIERKQREAASKYGGGGMSQFFGSKPSELSPGVRERYIIDRNKFFDKATATKDNEKIVEASYVWGDAPSQSESESLGKYKFTTDRLSELSELIEGETTGPISGVWRNFKAGLGLDDKALLIKAQITKIIPGLARGVFGEVGVLTDQDVAMYSKTIGNLNTPEEVNEALTEAAMDMVARGFENKLSTLAKSRKNVSGYLDQLRDVKKQSSELLGIEDEEPAVIEVESFGDSGVELDAEQAAAARAAAGPDGRVRVRIAGTDQYKEINVNPPAEKTSPAPKPLLPMLEELWPGSTSEVKAETAKPTDERRKWEARIEVFNNRLAEVVAEKRGRISQTSEEKKLRTAIAKAEAELKKL